MIVNVISLVIQNIISKNQSLKGCPKNSKLIILRNPETDQALTVYWLLDSSLLSLFLFSDSQEPIVNDIKLKDKFSLQSVMDSMCCGILGPMES